MLFRSLETRKGCITRYTWDNAVKTWINYFDNVELKKLKGKWNSPSLMQKPPNEIPKNIDNEKFVEWIFTKLIQDEEDSYNYKMLSMLRDLNYSASMDFGKLDNFNKNMAINNRNAHLNLMEQIKITQLAHARIIAKIDPAFNKDMASPEARAQSDKIGEEVLKKLISEHKFSNPNGV